MGYPYATGFPAAVMPSTLTFPEGSHVRVGLCGEGPGSYFDFARSPFQVPANGSRSANNSPPAANANSITAKTVSSRFMFCPPWMHSWVVPLSKEWYAGDYAGLPGCVKSFQSTREMVETRIFKRNLVSCGKLEPPTRRLRERSEAILTQYHSLPTCCFVA